MELKDLKVDKKDKKETAIAEAPMDYPMGTKLYLEEDAIAKLGLDKMPAPGMSVKGGYEANVESASIHKGPDGQRRSLCLQITKLGVEAGKEKDEENEMAKEETIPNEPSNDGPSAEKVLYGD